MCSALGGATLALLEMTVRVDSALDVGCGCGIIYHSRRTATDLARACALTSAALNEAVIDITRGLPLPSRRGWCFDLIASPPFVIT